MASSRRSTISLFVLLVTAGMFCYSAGRYLKLRLMPGPRLELQPALVDLGVVRVHEPVRTSFTIHNGGSEPLLVLDVKPSCQCTVASVSNHSLAVGQSAQVDLVFEASEAGAKTQQILLRTNDRHEPEGGFTLNARAVAAPATQPAENPRAAATVSERVAGRG